MARVEYLFKVPPTVFRPRPKVDSAVVRLTPRADRLAPDKASRVAGLIKACFQKRRKQLATILRGTWGPECEGALAKAGLSGSERPEVLLPEKFVELAALLPAPAGTGPSERDAKGADGPEPPKG